MEWTFWIVRRNDPIDVGFSFFSSKSTFVLFFFSSNIENVNEQQLLITVLDSDCGEKQGMKTVIKEKRGFQG